MATVDQIMVTVTNSNSFGSVGDVIAALALALSVFNLVVLIWINRIIIDVEVEEFRVLDADYGKMTFEAKLLITNRSRLPISITKMSLSTKSDTYPQVGNILPAVINSLDARYYTFIYSTPISDEINFDNGLAIHFKASRGKPRKLTLYRDSVIRITRFRAIDKTKSNRQKR